MNSTPTFNEYPTYLETVYRHFTANNELMNMRQFLKFANDAKFLDKKFTKADIGFIFAKITAQDEKKISFDKFKESFIYFAHKKKINKNDIVIQAEAFAREKFYKDPFSFVTTVSAQDPAIKMMTGFSRPMTVTSRPSVSTRPTMSSLPASTKKAGISINKVKTIR